MNNNEKYFVSLISSFLNKKSPKIPHSIDWNEIYRLSEIHNVTAITASQISMLSEEYRPENKLHSSFRQQIGHTLINYDRKIKAYEILRGILEESNIEYLFVKGIILNNIYPVKEFRTSGDIDVIIRDEKLNCLKKALEKNNIEITEESAICLTFSIQDIQIEAHSNLYSDNKYFDNIFNIAKKNGLEYTLSPENHLLYVLCHIIKHFNFCGAGIRMFMDIDVLIRNYKTDINFENFFSKCRTLNMEHFAKSSLLLCRHWFSTPVDNSVDNALDKDIIELFEREILSGGSFGFENRGLADFYISQGIGKSNQNGFKAKTNALICLLFPKKEYLYAIYPYAKRHHVLLPVAWLHRIINGIFKRKAQSVNTVSSILNADEKSSQYKKLLNELQI